MMKKIYLFLVLCCLQLAAFGQTTVTIYADSATSKSRSVKASAASVLSLQNDSIVVRDQRNSAAATSNLEHGYCVFDLASAGIPAGATVTAVTLGYYVNTYFAGVATSANYHINAVPGDLSSNSNADILNGILKHDKISTSTPLFITTGTTGFGTAVGNQTLTLNRNLSWIGNNAGGKISIIFTERSRASTDTRRYAIMGYTGNATSTTTNFHRPFITVTYTAPSTCSGTPTAGTTIATPQAGNAATFHVLSLSGASSTAGLTYQWQSSSTEGGTYTNISGATQRTYSFSNVTATTYYRCAVTCSGSTVNSTPTPVFLIAAYSCTTPVYSLYYYANWVVSTTYPLGGMTANMSITGDSSTSIVDSMTPSPRSYNNQCNNFGQQGLILYKGFTHNMTVRSGNYGQNWQTWIDYNNNGTFEATELRGGANPGTAAGASNTVTLTAIPATVATGYYRMRLATVYGTTTNPIACPTAYTYGNVRDFLVKITNPPPAATATPSSMAFGYITTGTSSHTLSSAIAGTYLVPTSGSITVTAPSLFEVSPDGSTWASSYTASYTTATYGGTMYARFNPTAATTSTDTIRITGGGLSPELKIPVTGTGATPCTGTPTPGTAAVTPTTGSSATTFNLSLTGSSTSGGLTYQWQSSSSGSAGTWSNISGATNMTYSFSGMTVSTYFRCLVTCSFSAATDSSASVLATWVLPTSSCTPTTSTAAYSCSSYQMILTKVILNGATGYGYLGDSAACSTTGYNDRTTLSTTLYKSYSYTANMSTGTSYAISTQWWIDFNSNGAFESTEVVGGNSTTFTTAGSATLTIPSTVPSGVYRMRVYTAWSSPVYPAINPCGGHTYGGARDYTVTIMNPPPYGTNSRNLNFGTVGVGTTTSADTSRIAGFFLLPTSGSVTVTAPSNYEVSSTGTTWASSYTTAYTAVSGIGTLASQLVYVRFNPTAVATYSDTVRISGGGLATNIKIPVTGSGAYPCTGAPTTGTLVASDTIGYPSTTFNFSLSGASLGLGLVYQWQSSATGTAGTFTNISGATNPTYSVTALSGGVYYRVTITCSYSGLSATSSSRYVRVYCNTSAIVNRALSCTSYGMVINALNVTGYSGSISDALACDASGFRDRSSLSCTLRAGDTYTPTIGTAVSYNMFHQAWIDFDDNGIFDSVETIGYNTTAVTTSIVGTWNIPLTATVGTHRMRVIVSYNFDTRVPPAYSSCGTGHNYGEGRDYTIVIAPPAPRALATPSSVSFGSVTTGTTSSALTTSLLGSYLIPTSGSITVTGPSSFFEVSPDGSTWSTSYTQSYSSGTYGAASVYVRFSPSSTITYNDTIRVTGGGLASAYNIPVTGVGAPVCTGTPTAGTASCTPTSGSSSVSFTHSLTGTTVSGGLTYQWYTASSYGGSYSAISGATNPTYTTSGITATTYYYCQVACSVTGLSTNSTIDSAIWVIPSASCTPTTSSAGYSCTSYQMTFLRVAVTGELGSSFNDVLACNSTGYRDRTSLSATLYKSYSYNFAITTGSTYTVSTQWWIDFNGDGTFQSTETVGGSALRSGALTASVTIPATVASGTYRMRGFTSYSSPVYPSINPCGGHTYGEARDYTINITNPPPYMTLSTTSRDFGPVATSTCSSTLTSTLNGYFLTPASGSVTITAPTNYQVFDGSSWTSSFNYSYTGGSITSYSIMMRLCPPATSTYSGNVSIAGGGATTMNIAVTGYGATACSGTPTAGTTTASDTFASGGATVVLGLSGSATGLGLSYQWYSSATGTGSWTAITGATSATYNLSATGTTTYYYCRVSCSYSSLFSYSSVVRIIGVCTPTYTSASLACSSYGMVFGRVTLAGSTGTLADSAACNGTGYNSRTGLSTSLWRGFNYTITMVMGSATYGMCTQWWIDFNSDGTFQTTESVGGNATQFNGTGTATLTIPSGVSNGRYMMRGICGYYYGTYSPPNYVNFPNFNPCGGHYYGEARDYMINIIDPPPAITTAPATLAFGGVVVSSASASQSFTFSGNYFTPATGSLTVTAPAYYEVSPDGSTWSTSYTVGYTGSTLATTTGYARFTPPSATTYIDTVRITGGGLSAPGRITVTGTGAGACSATPTAGTAAVTPSTGSTATAFILSLSGTTVAGGLTYQWASSSTGTAGSFTNISGATTPSYSFSGITANTYYKCFVTCPTYGTDSTASIMATYVLPSSSCSPTTISASLACTSYQMVFTKVIMNTASGFLGDSAACSTSGYQDRTSLSATLWRGSSYTMNMSTGATYGITSQWWIDFNSNGTFETTEAVGGNISQFSTSGSCTITIPSTVSPGIFRMRGFSCYYYGTYSPPNYVNYPNFNPCGGHQYGEARDYTIVITNPPPSVSVTPTSLAFGGVLTGSSSAAQTYAIAGLYLLPTSGSLTVTAPTDFEVSNNGTTWASSYTIGYTGGTLSSTTSYVRFNPSSASVYNDTVRVTGGGLSTATKLVVTGTGAGACSATPTAGTAAISPTTGSTSTTFTLSLTGTTVASGLTYQWAESTTGTAGSFTSIAGATTPMYIFTGISATKYYKCFVTCPTYGTDSTASVTATYVLPASSCSATTTNAALSCTTYSMVFTRIRMVGVGGTLADSAACSTTGYNDRTSLSATLYKGSTYTMNMSTGVTYGIASQWWIDFNNNGTFESTEAVGGNTTTFTTSGTCTITIPSTVASGTFRMRGFSSYSSPVYPSINPCGGHNYGEARDYTINIATPPAVVTATPSSLAFGGVLTGTSSSALTTSITGTWLTPSTGSITVTAPSFYEVSSDGSTWTSSYTIGYTGAALSATTVYARFNPASAIAYNDTIRITGGGLTVNATVPVTGTGAGACAATPTAGTAAITPTTGSTGTSFTLSLTGTTVASGLTFQWKSASAVGGPYTNIAGATTSTYGFTGLTATTYYKCFVTCPTYGTDSTAAVTATYVLPASSCAPTTSNAALACTTYSMVFTRIRMVGVGGTLADSAACSTTGYNDRTVLSTTLYRGSTYTMNMSTGVTYGIASQWWIDFNNNGTFESTEAVGGNSTTFTTSGTCTITIPSSVSAGAFRMRGFSSYSSPVYPSINPCGGHTYGEARDYTIIIATPPAVVTATPSSLAFGGVLTGTSSSALTSAIVGTWLSPTSGSLTVTAPSSNFEVSSDGSTWVTSYTIGYTGGALSSTTIYARFNPSSAISYADTIRITGGGLSVAAKIPVSGTGAGACAATPTAGTAAITPTTGSTGTSFTLSLTGTTLASGLTFQWKTSTTGVAGSFTNISGATTSSYGFTGISTNRYYKCFVTCPTYGTDSSNTVTATYVLPASSCSATTTSASLSCSSYLMILTKVRIPSAASGFFGDSAACSTTGYSDRTSLSLTLYSGSSYTVNMSTGATYGISTQWWIDFNNNGTFETSESVGGNSTTFISTGTTTISVPSGSATGTFRMRVFTSYSSPVYPSINPCGGHTYGGARDYTVVISTPPPSISTTPSALSFGSVTVGTTSSSINYVITADNMVPASGSLTLTAPTGYQLSADGSTGWASSYTVGYTGGSLSAASFARFSPASAISYNDTIRITGGGLSPEGKVAVTGTGATACSGTPTAGSASITPSTGTTSTSFTLNLTGSTSAGGLTYQWQMSDYGTAGSYTNIAGATTIAYTFTGIPNNRYFQCIVRCGTDSAISTATMATYVLPSASCTPSFSSAALACTTYQMVFLSMNLTGAVGSISDALACNSTGYRDRTSLFCGLITGNSYTATVQTGATYATAVQFWIDFNNDGVFQSSEAVGGTGGSSTGTYTTTLTIPGGVSAGVFRMRAVMNYAGAVYPSINPCGGVTYGEGRDYTVIIITPTACSGAPTAGATTSSATTGCAPLASTLNITGSAGVTGITYQWLSSSTGAFGSWSAISGATASSYSATTTTNTYYRCRLVCTGSGGVDTSTAVYVTPTTAPGSITGGTYVCSGGLDTLYNTVTGGTWSSSATGVATIHPTTGVLTGSSIGTCTISYTVAGCSAVTLSYSVNGSPASITGFTSLCVGGSSSLTSATVGGTWSSANSAIATVDPSTGVTTGMSAGTTTISYSNGCGTPATTSWTTNVTPTAIVGPSSICTLSTGTFTDSITGGTWSNSPTTYGTINSTTGLFTATSTTGTSTLTYTIGFCSVNGTAVIGAISPDTVVGASAVCRSGSTTYTCATSGGVWSSSDAGIATVHPTTGVVTGVSSGTATISYSTGCGTPSTRSITVNGSPVTITVPTTCSQGNLTLTASVGAGSYTYSWSGPLGFTSTAASPVISSASTSRSGIYSVTATQSGCASSTSYWVSVDTTAQVTVNASPATICPGSSSTVTNAVSSPAIGSYVLNAIPFAPLTLSSSTAGPTGTNANATVTMPFGFNFYGTSYSTVRISTNGYINFGAAATANSSVALPNSAGTTPKAMIAPFWHYMNASTGTIYYTTLGVSPNRKFVVQFNGVADFSGGGTNTAQVVLYETSNVIDMFVSQKTSATYTAVCGIQDAAGTSALTVPGQNSATYTINNTTAGTGWRFSQPNYNYAWSPATGLSSTTATAPVATLSTSTSYTVTTVDANSGCTTGTNAPVTVNVYSPATLYTVTPDSGCTAGTTIGLSGSQAGFTYNLFRSATNVGTLTGTGSALSFGSMTTAGAYRVVATTTDGCNTNMSDTSMVYDNPTAYSVTGGNGCTAVGVAIGLSSSQSGVSYDLVRDGSTVVTTVAGTGSAISFGTQTTAGTYTVRGTFTTGGACQTNMTGSSVISTNPSAYTLTGGSTGCSSTGLTLGLSNSDTGVNYQLYRDASTVGSPVSGTGSAISFGMQTTAGTYTIVATGAGSCQTNMTGSAVITTSPSVTLGANPSVCQPISSTNISYSGAVGTPTLYSITWDSTSLATGFSNVSSASLPGSIPLSIPSSVHGVFGGTITVANAACTSSSYTFSLTVYEHPDATITSAVVPCSGYSTNIVFTGTPGASVSISVDSAAPTTGVMTAGTYTLSTGALTGTHTYHLIEAYNAVCSDATVDTTISITANLMQWVGGTTGSESDWSTNANWGCGFYPTVNDDAIIPSGTTYAPVLSSASGTTRNLTIASGATLSIGSGLNVAVKGDMNNAGTVSGNGKIVLSGTSAQAIGGIGDVNSLELNNTSGASISASSRVTVKKVLTITAGTLSTNDSLVLYSDTTGSARVAPIASGNISGNVKVMQYVPGGRRAYRFMAHPFSSAIALGQLSTGIDVTGQGGSTNGFTTTGSNAASAFRYNTLVSNSASSYDPGWKAFTSALATSDTNSFARYQGIRIFIRGARGEGLSYATYTPSPTTMTTVGALNQGTQTVTLAKGGAANQEYNMVGNPYASPVDIGTVAHNAKVSGNIVGAAIYVWNPYLATVGQFQAIPVNTTSATPYYLQANASFQVRAGHNGDSLVFTESNKSANATATVIKGLPDYVSLFVYDAQYHPYDMLHIKFGAEATDNEDNDFDAAKPQGPDFNLYSISADDRKLAIDGRPYAAGKSIPLGINSNYNQEFIIKTEALSVPTGGRVFLHDKLLNQYVMLQQGTEYKFNVTKDAATQGDKRFELTMEPGVDATSNGLQVTMTPNPASNEVSISYTSGNAEHVTVKVSDLTGMNVFTKDMGVQQNGKVIVPITNLAAGIYMVELTSGSQKVVQRLIKE